MPVQNIDVILAEPFDTNQGTAMRRAIELSLFILFACVASPTIAKDTTAPSESLESVMTTKVDGTIAIDQQGQLTDFHIDTKMPEQMRGMLYKTVRTWRFHPVLVDGNPIAAQSKIRITLAARKDGEDYLVRVDNVIFPRDDKERKIGFTNDAVTITKKSMTPPSYPRGLLKAGVEGIVLLSLRIGADGQVEQVIPVQTTLIDVKGRPNVLAQALTQFERTASSAAKLWQFNVTAKTGQPTARDMTVMVPISYTINRKTTDSSPGMWRTEVRGPRQQPNWLVDNVGEQRIGVSDLADGEVMPVASAFKLVTDVVGTALL